MKGKFVIELGSSNTVIYKQGNGIVLIEPSVLAINQREKTFDVGTKAKKMMGKTDETILVVEPIERGIIKNDKFAEMLLKGFLHKVCGEENLSNYEVKFCVSIGLTDNQLSSYLNIAYSIGFGKVSFIDVCISALKGANVNIEKSTAIGCVNIGGGTTNFAVVSLGKVIEGFSVSFGGKDMDNSIIEYLKAVKNIEITSSLAEKLKNECGSLYVNDTTNMEIVGIDVDTKKAVNEIISAQEIREAIVHFFDNIKSGIEHLLYSCTPDVISDINSNGIYVVGEVAKMVGLEQFLSKKLNFRVIIPDEPETCTILGASSI